MKIVVLTCNARGIASRCLPALCESPHVEVERVILAHGVSPQKTRLLKRKIAKAFKIGMLGALNGIRLRSWYLDKDVEDLKSVCDARRVPFHETDFINCDQTRRLFTEANADLGLSLGNGYIAPSVFSIAQYGMINVHQEILPAYQNAQSIVWPIYRGDFHTGLTIHEIDRRIDAGRVLYQEKYLIEFRRRLKDTVIQNLAITRRKTPVAICYVLENFMRLRENATEQKDGQSYTTPSFQQFLQMVRNNRRMCRDSARDGGK